MNGTAIWAAGHCRPSESARELQRTNAPRPIMANSPVTSLEEKEEPPLTIECPEQYLSMTTTFNDLKSVLMKLDSKIWKRINVFVWTNDKVLEGFYY